MEEFEVCAAVVIRRGRILLATRRPGSRNAGCWEFPEGKVQSGECLGECIAREIREELAFEVTSVGEIGVLREERPAEGKVLVLHFMECVSEEQSSPVPQEGQRFGWYSPEEGEGLTLAPLDSEFLRIHLGELTRRCNLSRGAK